MNTKKQKKKLSLTVMILTALFLGILSGLLLQGHPKIAENYIQPFGTIFLNLIKMIVVPVVLFSIIQGVVSLQDIKKVGSIGGKTICCYHRICGYIWPAVRKCTERRRRLCNEQLLSGGI